MKGKLYQRMITGICACIIVATGVFAPVSLGILNQQSSHDTQSYTFATMQPLIAQGQGVQQFGQGAELQVQSFQDICGSTNWGLDLGAVGCSILLWGTRGAFQVSGVLAGAAGGLFDYMLWFTIQSSTYAQSDFIETGWGILRDLANIIFIIALIIAALNIMLSGVVSIANRDGKKMLASVIVAALLINFSLFFAQVIVDASHILARTFYNSISTNIAVDAAEDTFGDNNTPQKQLSVALIGKINPQKMILNPDIVAGSTFGWVTIITLYTFMTIIHGVLIFVFLSMALMFVGRTVALMFGMIISPFAFATIGTPLDNLPYVGFSTWMKDLSKNAFMVPVFLFFLYLTVLFMDGALLDIEKSLDNSWSKTLGQRMIDILIPMSLIVGLLMAGKSAAGKMASEIAAQANSIVGKGVGMLAGSALTVGAGALTMGAAEGARALGKGAGLALRKGSAWTKKYENKKGIMGKIARTGAASTTMIGSGMGSLGARAQSANVDIRSSFLGKKAFGALGNAGFSGMSFGEGKYTSAQAKDDEKKKNDLVRTERNLMLVNQSKEAEKKAKDKIIVDGQSTIDDIREKPKYKTAEEAEQAKYLKAQAETQAAKEILEKIREQFDTDVKAKEALIAAMPTSTKNEKAKLAKEKTNFEEFKKQDRGKISDQSQTVSRLEKKEKKISDGLESGKFFETDEVKKDNDDKNKIEVEIGNLEELKSLLKIDSSDRTSDQQKRIGHLQSLVSAKDPSKEDILDKKKELKHQEEIMNQKAKGDDEYAFTKARLDIDTAEKNKEKIDKQMNVNKRRMIKQELDLMNNTGRKIAASLVAGLAGGLLVGAPAAVMGAPMGAMAAASVWGGASSGIIGSANSLAHGFTETQRNELQEIFRRTTKKEDK